jgi:hypothetical protein
MGSWGVSINPKDDIAAILYCYTISIDITSVFLLYDKYDEDRQADNTRERSVQPFDCIAFDAC